MFKATVTKRSDPDVTAVRKLKAPQQRLWQPSTWQWLKPVAEYAPLPKARLLFALSAKVIWKYKATFAALTGLYVVLTLLLVQGTGIASNFVALKAILEEQQASSVLPQLGYLFSTIGTADSAAGGVYQMILLIIFSLAIIWVLRQSTAKHAVSFKAAFYQGMYPLIPFLLIVFIFSLQLLPLSLGLYVYNVFIAGGIAVTGVEQLLVVLVALALIGWSLYMVTAGIFAFYIVTLADMTPLKAYRSAKQLVRGRRLQIWRKLLYLPIAVGLCITGIILPFLLIAPPIAPWIFIALSALALPFAHTYLYTLYREMLS